MTTTWTAGTPPDGASRAAAAVNQIAQNASAAQTSVTNTNNAIVSSTGATPPSGGASSTDVQTALQAIPGNNVTGVTQGNTINDDVQATADAIHQAVVGGNATGTPIANIKDNLQNIPQSNIVIDADAGTGGSVLFDSAAAGSSTGSFTGTGSASWSHTVGASANFLVVIVHYESGGNESLLAQVAVMSGSTQVAVGQQLTGIGGSDGYTAIFGAQVAPGTYTVKAYVTPAAPGAGITGTSLSYQNVSSVGGKGWGGGNTASSPSLSITDGVANSNARTVQVFVNSATTVSGASTALSSYSGGTQHFNTTFGNGSTTFKSTMLVGDTASASTETFSATAANPTANSWVALAITMEPPTASVGSHARVARRSTTVVQMSSGANLLPSGAYDTVETITSDLTFTNDANNGSAIQVSLAGSYLFMFQIFIDTATVSTTDQFIPLLVVNGAPASWGPANAWTNTEISTIGWTTPVYLKPGDKVTGGIYFADGWSFIGSASEFMYMELALMNRSLH